MEADLSSGKGHLFLRSWDSAETLNEAARLVRVLCVCCKQPIANLREKDIADIKPCDLFIFKNIAYNVPVAQYLKEQNIYNIPGIA